MAAVNEFPLALVVRAVDRVSAPLREIAAKVEAINAPFKKAGKDAARFGDALNLRGIGSAAMGFGGALRNVGSEVFNLGARVATVGAVAGVAFASMVKGAVETGDQLATMAERVGVSADFYASLGHAANLADVDQEQFNMGMDKFNKQLGDMTAGKGGEFLAFLNEIGPGFAKQIKGAKGTEEALRLMTEAFAKIPDPQRRATLAAHAFGKANTQMGVFLHQGTAKIHEQMAEFTRLAGSQNEFASNSSDLDNALKNTELAFHGLESVVGGALFPALTELAGLVTEFVVKNRDGLKEWAQGAAKSITDWVKSGGFERLVQSGREFVATVQAVGKALGPVGLAIGAAVVVAGPLIASLGTLAVSAGSLAVSLLPALSAAIGLLGPTFAAMTAAMAPFAVALTPLLAIGALVILGKQIQDNWEPLAFIFKDWGNSLKWAVLDAWTTVQPILEKVSGIFGGHSNPFGTALQLGKAVLGDSRSPTFGSPVGAAAAAPRTVTTNTQTEAKVTVDFVRLPPGARVTKSGDQPIDLSTGFSMVTP